MSAAALAVVVALALRRDPTLPELRRLLADRVRARVRRVLHEPHRGRIRRRPAARGSRRATPCSFRYPRRASVSRASSRSSARGASGSCSTSWRSRKVPRAFGRWRPSPRACSSRTTRTTRRMCTPCRSGSATAAPWCTADRSSSGRCSTRLGPPRAKKRKCVLCFSVGTHESRRTCYETLKDAPFVLDLNRASGGWTETSEFYAAARESMYTLAPRGFGVDTHRFYEAIFLWSVPIVVRTGTAFDRVYAQFPCLVVEAWSDVTEPLPRRGVRGVRARCARSTRGTRGCSSTRAPRRTSCSGSEKRACRGEGKLRAKKNRDGLFGAQYPERVSSAPLRAGLC